MNAEVQRDPWGPDRLLTLSRMGDTSVKDKLTVTNITVPGELAVSTAWVGRANTWASGVGGDDALC